MLRWIIEHDEKRLFLVGDVGLSLLLTIGISLFWLLFLVGVHFLFEMLKDWHYGARDPRRLLAWAAWDIKFDIALVTVAIFLAALTEAQFGIAGIGGLSRISATFSKVTRGFIPIKDIVLGLRIVCTRKLDRRDILQRRLTLIKDQKRANIEEVHRVETQRLQNYRYPWDMKWNLTNKIILGVMVVNVCLTIGVIFLNQNPPLAMLEGLIRQLHPWPR